MRPRRLSVATAAVVGALVVAGGLAAVFTGDSHARTRHSSSSPPLTSTSTTVSAPANGWRVVPPATVPPADTPVQREYDDGFERGFSSVSNKEMIGRADSLDLPLPAIDGGWPALQVAYTPEGWTTEFVAGLMDISFAHESRDSLGAWLVAEEAPDLMPGIPLAFQERSLYVSLLDPGIAGQASPIPPANEWIADADAGVLWSVSDLEVQLEPEWQQMIEAGWQPPDIRASVEDVSGLLSITTGTVRTTRRFSMVVQVGSAHWHDGYGSVLVSDWAES